MKKTIFLILTFVNLAYGYNYDILLLKAQASIFPKIMLLDKKLPQKLVDGKIVYTIVYDKSDYNTALKTSELIDEYYNGHFDKYVYKINLIEFSNFSKETQTSVIYALNSDKNIEKVANVAKERGIISFSYDVNNLKKGLLFSLVLEKSTVLYLNKEVLYVQKVDFVDSLLQMVKFVDNNNNNINHMLFNNTFGFRKMYAKVTSTKNNYMINN